MCCAQRLAGAFHAPTQMSATLPQSAKNFFRSSATDAYRGRLRTSTTLVKLCGVRCCVSATQRAGGASKTSRTVLACTWAGGQSPLTHSDPALHLHSSAESDKKKKRYKA